MQTAAEPATLLHCALPLPPRCAQHPPSPTGADYAVGPSRVGQKEATQAVARTNRPLEPTDSSHLALMTAQVAEGEGEGEGAARPSDCQNWPHLPLVLVPWQAGTPADSPKAALQGVEAPDGNRFGDLRHPFTLARIEYCKNQTRSELRLSMVAKFNVSPDCSICAVSWPIFGATPVFAGTAWPAACTAGSAALDAGTAESAAPWTSVI